MKNLTIFTLCWLSLVTTIGLIGCGKDECDIVEKELWGVRADGKLLIFESIGGFEYLVANESQETRESLLRQVAMMDFQNYFSAPVRNNDIENTEIQEMDEILGQLLNIDGAIQIGSHIYKLDLTKELVFVIPVENRERDYNDLIAGNANNPNVLSYSIDSDVLHIVDEGKEYKCGEIGNISKEEGIKTEKIGDIPFEIRARHFRGGIFFRTSALAQYPPELTGIHFLRIEAKAPRIWLKPCESNKAITIPAGVLVDGQFHTQGYEAYSGTRNLNGMYFFVRARLTLSTPNGQPSTTFAVTEWAGRNVNSPH